jgi:hypothetical protein
VSGGGLVVWWCVMSKKKKQKNIKKKQSGIHFTEPAQYLKTRFMSLFHVKCRDLLRYRELKKAE